ncbi:hypothetical protein TCAL_08322 [Tigriopus californicus]|uniref:SH3 domain-containing protein n=1 Tax=Tigriopus californicus TaxID=6832 RepID=A0A553PCD8_TIGCA|nr:epidermal growth factor receptor kinase substrate 8-like [Tigriopus californicus]TRY75328.1 hypothetical protein TCAL_08322 [Tigriopus californicus]|eukprot:TCALIF_08322-PA protein Name:"Similar to Eps8l2 Epidermal growth factor receptor kinase substrate 8-like protein 2 (Mus musculus)" AED:0.02 eAED:0.02 QI:88/1/1/1/1/1/11/163/703
MDFLDRVLPVYVDYLGSFESVPHDLEDGHDVMKHLLDHGVQSPQFVPNAEIIFTQDHILIKDVIQNVVARRVALTQVADPMAFIAKSGTVGSGLSRVVVFTETNSGYFGRNRLFHAVQCLDSDPSDLVESITNFTSPLGHSVPSLMTQKSQNSLDINWKTEPNDQPIIAKPPIVHSSGGPFNGFPPVVPLITSDTANMVGHAKPQFQYNTTTDPVEKKTILLNACIDDIERFCGEVEIIRENRQNIRQGHEHVKREDFRASDFVKIFQKFKLTFNLLGDLDGHIEEPDASTLVHHLLPPLALLVDKCYEDYSDDLIRDVANPPLTRTSANFLNRVLHEREVVIWKALGDNWYTPKFAMNEMAPYKPIFQDGWSPGLVMQSADHVEVVEGQRSNIKKSSIVHKETYEDDDFIKPNIPVGGSHDDFRDSLMAKQAKIGLVLYSRDRQNKRELSVTKGEYLEVTNSDKKWWHCRNGEGKSGYVPHTLLKALIYSENFGDSDANRDAQWKRSPRTYSSSREDRSPSPVMSVAPPPPPMPQKSPESVVIPIKRNTGSSKYQNQHSVRSTMSMQEELKNVLDVFKDNQKNHLEVTKTPDIYIGQDSTPHEVREWLRQKQFSERVLSQLSGFNGSKVLELSRKNLIASFGKEEGARLDSQLTLSKNTKGYRTARSSELRAVLERARKKTDTDDHYISEEEESDPDFYSRA